MEVKGYKQTEVGTIPVDWNAVAMETITTHIGDGLHGTPVYSPNGDFFFINGNNLRDGRIVITSETKSVAHSEFIKHRKPLSDRSILMSINGTVGNLGLFNGEPIMLGKSAAYLNVRPEISKQFVYHSLQTQIVKQQFFDGMTGSTIGNLGLATIRQTQIPLPPTEAEQRAIATALNDVDTLLDKINELIAKKRDLKTAAVQQFLTGQTRLPGFHGKWKMKKLGMLGSTYGGLTGKSKRDFGDGAAQYVTFLNVITNVVIDCEGFERVRVAPSESQNRVLCGDLLFNGSSETPEEVAMCALMNKDVTNLFLNSFCFGFRLQEDAQADGLFLAYYMRSRVGRELMKSLAQGSTRYNLSKAALLDASIRLPTFPEQKAIAAALTDMDAELSALELRRDKIRALKQAMMQELLTGKTRLVPTGGANA